MQENKLFPIELKRSLPLDEDFYPAILWYYNFCNNVRNSKKGIPFTIAIRKDNSSILVHETQIFSNDHDLAFYNYFYIEQLIKTFLWIYGGYKIVINGSKEIGEYIKKVFSKNGKYAFDFNFMSSIFEKTFTIEISDNEKIPKVQEKSIKLGGHLNGCRIGFDLGASDRKVSAIIDGKVVFSEEVPWSPCIKTDPNYHYHEIMSMLHRAAAHMPHIDAIGGSSAGIYLNNRVKSASIFRAIPADIFDKKVKNIFLDIQKYWGVPLKVINDGEVTALAGSMSLKKNKILGIAMGSSEAGGYINKEGSINGWLNELAFIPIDLSSKAPIDEWSGSKGCGVQYFSQIAVVRLAEKAGILLDNILTLAEKLKSIQEMMIGGDERVERVFETIGYYLGYGIAYYAQFYDTESVLVLGRVTSGKGGRIILEKAKKVLNEEFAELSNKITMYLPDESSRRIGQSIAAASLPMIKG